ncbi:MAG: hypothetical protein ACOYNN_06195 [Terrimicrobiaceae bacterium]|jgi:hypothetical protein
MKTKYDPMKALSVPLTAYEKEIENAIAENTLVADPGMNSVLEKAARETLQAIRRGGMRPGAGRKARPHVRTTVLLAPNIRRKLERIAKSEGSLSAAVESLVKAA